MNDEKQMKQVPASNVVWFYHYVKRNSPKATAASLRPALPPASNVIWFYHYVKRNHITVKLA